MPNSRGKKRHAGLEKVKPDEATVDTVVRLLCNLQDRASIVRACLVQLKISPDDVDALIEAATEKLARAAQYHRDHELGRAIIRLNECYRRAVADKDNKAAIAAQRELIRLLGLGPGGADDEPPAPTGGGDVSADAPASEKSPPDAPPKEEPPSRRTIENHTLADVVAAIEGHLDPLGLSDDVNDTDADMIRMAGEEIRRLRKIAGKAKGGEKRPHAARA